MLHVILRPNPMDDPADSQCAHLSIGDKTQAEAIAHQHDRIEKVIADGEELEHIIQNYMNLFFRLSVAEMTWFGDDAKFIVANW